jgi:hypothetical protein
VVFRTRTLPNATTIGHCLTGQLPAISRIGTLFITVGASPQPKIALLWNPFFATFEPKHQTSLIAGTSALVLCNERFESSTIAPSRLATKTSCADVCSWKRAMQRSAGTAVGGSSIALAICIVIGIVLAPAAVLAEPAAMIECRSAKPSEAREYWSWRLIDGRQCWYAGRPGRSKATLHWPSPPKDAPLPTKRETSGVGSVRNTDVIKPKPVTTLVVSPGPVERAMVPLERAMAPVERPMAPASFDERFAAHHWSKDRSAR